MHGQRSLAGYGPWGRKEPDTTEQRTPREILLVVTSQINWCFFRAQGLVVSDCPLKLSSNHTSSVKSSFPYSTKGNFTSFGILVSHYFYKSKYWYFCWYSSMNPQGPDSIIHPGFFSIVGSLQFLLSSPASPTSNHRHLYGRAGKPPRSSLLLRSCNVPSPRQEQKKAHARFKEEGRSPESSGNSPVFLQERIWTEFSI